MSDLLVFLVESFQQAFIFTKYFVVLICVYVCRVLAEAKECVISSEVGVTGGLELPGMGTRNHTWVL